MRKTLVIIIAFICLLACHSSDEGIEVQNLDTKGSISRFWKWFAENKTKFETGNESETLPDLNPIVAQLRPISDGLSVEISREVNGVREMTISAEGDKEKFPIVREIVAAAPPIQGWTVVAFRQRANMAFALRTNQLEYKTAEMFFEPLVEGDEFDVIIYAEGLKGVPENVTFHYGMIVVDNLLGEYDSVMKVRRYDFRELSDAPHRSNLKALSELPTFVDKFSEKANK